MAEYSSNLLINPYADEPITTGWTATENAEVISSGYLGSAFRLNSPAYLEQVIPVDTFGEDTKGIQLSCRARFTNSGPALYAEIVLYLRLQITNADGTTAFFMPCQTIIMPGVSTWILFEKGFEERISGITEVVFRVYSINENVVVDLDNISVAIDETRTESEQAFDDAVDYTNMGIEAHLNDITNSHLSDEQKNGLTGGAQRVRSIKLGMETNVRIANRNLYGQLPLVKLEAIREQTPIITPLFWTELLVKTVANVTSTSVAVQYDENGIGKVYVAYVADGTLYIRAAQFSYPISEMIWEDIEEIPGCAQCALEFDGRFIVGTDEKIKYYTDELPWLFYVTSTGQLMAGVLGGSYESLVGANVTAVDAVRGVASKYHDIDQGLIVFYIIAGTVYYKEYIAGSWGSQETVSIAPADSVSIRVARTFDYRIVLQIEDSSGNLHEVFTKMVASGWNGLEFATITNLTVLEAVMHEVAYLDYRSQDERIDITNVEIDAWLMNEVDEPELRHAENVPIEASYYGRYETYEDWGYLVLIEFNQIVLNVEDYPQDFVLEDDNGTLWYGQEVYRESEYDRSAYVLFTNFNNAVNPLTVTALGGRFSNGIMTLVDTSVQFNAQNLVPFAVDPPVLTGIYNTDNVTIILTFDKPIVSIASQSGFSITAQEPYWSPEGATYEAEYVVDNVDYLDPLDKSIIKITLTDTGRMKHPQGDVTVAFAGQLDGGFGALVEPFIESFTPTDLVLFFNPADHERVSIEDVRVTNATITEVAYIYHDSGGEHVTISGVSVTLAKMTHINDIPE